MITPDFCFYMRFGLNTSKVRLHGELVDRKNPRYDLEAISGFWTGFQKILNAKGTVSFLMMPTEKNPHFKQEGSTPESNLSIHIKGLGSSYNLTGVRPLIQFEHDRQICSGEPFADRFMRGGVKNPLYEEREDGFIIIQSDFDKATHWPRVTEIWVIDKGRIQVDAYRKAVYLKMYDEPMSVIRNNAKTYGGL